VYVFTVSVVVVRKAQDGRRSGLLQRLADADWKYSQEVLDVAADTRCGSVIDGSKARGPGCRFYCFNSIPSFGS